MSIYANSYSLRYADDGITDQKIWGTCVESSLQNMVTNQFKLFGWDMPHISRMQTYYDTREAQGTIFEDTGSIAAVTLEMAKARGMAFEFAWDYTPDHLYTQPTAEVYTRASNLKVANYMNIPCAGQTTEQTLEHVKEYLSQGKTILTSLQARDYLFLEHGPLATQVDYGGGASHGGHAMELVGCDDNINGGSYIFKGSWGTGYGDNGYMSVKYTQFNETANSDLMAMQVIEGYTVDKYNHIDLAYNPQKYTVEQFYAVVLERPADLGGLQYLQYNIQGIVEGATLINDFINSSEGQLIYGNQTDLQFINTAYHNVLGRDMDGGTNNFWYNILEQGHSKGFIYNAMITEANVKGSEGYDTLQNKTNLAEFVTIANQWTGAHATEVISLFHSANADANVTEHLKIEIVGVLGHTF